MNMREMKDSGIEWIGQVPSDWMVRPIRADFIEVTEKNKFGRVKTALKFTYGRIIPKENFDADEDSYVADTILNYTIVHPNTIMLNCLNLNFDFVSQRIGLVTETGAITSAYMAFKASNASILPQYATYLFKSYDNCKAFHNMGGGVRKILNFEEFKKKYYLLPSMAEQTAISSFLDEKCAELETLISDIQSQIEVLEEYKRSVITEAVTKGLDPDVEMRDSGVQWIGEIPTHWTLIRIGSLYGLRTQKVSDIDYPPLSVTKMGVLPQLDTVAKTNAHDDRKLVVKGDFVINSRSDRRGSCGISDYTGSVSLINTVLFPITEMNPRYYNWYFHTVGFADEFYRWGHGIVDDLWTTGWQDMKNILISVPPLDEQQRIADYLDNKCAEIDSIITEKKQQIETIKEYKKSLIFEYVTGKKEVQA